MDRWAGKIAIVTGASAGIGAAIAKALVEHNVKVVGLARRKDKLQELAAKLKSGMFYPIQCDLRNEESIVKAFKWTEKELGGADILVNNAGVIDMTPLIAAPSEAYRKVLDTNVISPTICAREFAQSIKKRKVPAHIVNINSIAGHFAESLYAPLGMYAASKYALTALGSELRHEFIADKLKIKITSISPGAVLTDMFAGVSTVTEETASTATVLRDKDIANAVIYTLGTPEGVEVHEIIIMPQNETIGVPKEMNTNLG
ncbi:farnesol dehydrogenase [Ptiloglossa arizonensis]|uniref:farnesol dehydrogenase n=1 Tax=Ptiloglossa arizonensis TaxID=3350558 RepID=UPI003FA006F9